MQLKQVGSYALGVVIFMAVLVIPWIVIGGLASVSDRVLPWLYTASTIALMVSLFIFAPLALFRRTRGFSAMGLFIASYVFGATTWMMGLILTWSLWGVVAVVVGILFLGVGVVFTATLATLFNGMWAEVGYLLLGVFLTYLWRYAAVLLDANASTEQIPDAWVVEE